MKTEIPLAIKDAVTLHHILVHEIHLTIVVVTLIDTMTGELMSDNVTIRITSVDDMMMIMMMMATFHDVAQGVALLLHPLITVAVMITVADDMMNMSTTEGSMGRHLGLLPYIQAMTLLIR